MAEQQLVKIRGTRMASVDLPHGEEQVVLYTTGVEQRIDYGMVEVVAWLPTTIDPETGAAVVDYDADAPAISIETQPEPTADPVPPKGNATRDEWAAFAADLVPALDVDLADPEVGRNDIMDAYEAWKAAREQ